MVPILRFLYFIITTAIGVTEFIVIAWAIMSWLVAFNVVNTRNNAVYQITRALEAVARPLLAPIQRFLPAPGGMDFSPIVFLVVAEGINRYLLPPLFGYLISLFAPSSVSI
jgi:YggT family protein